MILKYIVVTQICKWWRIVYNQIWPLYMATCLESSHLCLNVDKSTCMLIGSCQRVAGWTLLSQLVVVCCLTYILFGILVYWLTLCCLETCIFNTCFLELDQDLLNYLVWVFATCSVVCVLYSAFVMPLLTIMMSLLTIMMSFGLHPQQNRLVWLKSSFQIYMQAAIIILPFQISFHTDWVSLISYSYLDF